MHERATPLPAPGIHRGRQACTQLVRDLLMALAPSAAPDGASPAAAREVWLVDPSFIEWPLDEAPVLSAVAAWLRQGGRRLHIVGLDFEATARALPRFARWRRDWAHAIEVQTPVDGQLPASMRGLLAAPLMLQWLEAPDWRMRLIAHAGQAHVAASQYADFLQRCEPSWPANTLGL